MGQFWKGSLLICYFLCQRKCYFQPDEARLCSGSVNTALGTSDFHHIHYQAIPNLRFHTRTISLPRIERNLGAQSGLREESNP